MASRFGGHLIQNRQKCSHMGGKRRDCDAADLARSAGPGMDGDREDISTCGGPHPRLPCGFTPVLRACGGRMSGRSVGASSPAG